MRGTKGGCADNKPKGEYARSTERPCSQGGFSRIPEYLGSAGFIPCIVHIDGTANPTLGIFLNPLANLLELSWIADRFPGVRQVVGNVVPDPRVHRAREGTGETEFVRENREINFEKTRSTRHYQVS
jgi:hypothetical protein